MTIWAVLNGSATVRQYATCEGISIRETRRRKKAAALDLAKAKAVALEIQTRVMEGSCQASKDILEKIIAVISEVTRTGKVVDIYFTGKKSFLADPLNCKLISDITLGLSEGKVRAILDGFEPSYLFGPA